jgi:hypothetical protein
MHLKKMTMSWRSSSSFFLLFLCTHRRWQRQMRTHHPFLFVYVHPKKTTTN